MIIFLKPPTALHLDRKYQKKLVQNEKTAERAFDIVFLALNNLKMAPLAGFNTELMVMHYLGLLLAK